jgi:hypothetical protein
VVHPAMAIAIKDATAPFSDLVLMTSLLQPY